MASAGRKPLLANGSVVQDYEPLYRYWEAARRRGLEEVTIGAEELEHIERRVREGGRIPLLQLRQELAAQLLRKVDENAAEEAYKSLGVEIPRTAARQRIAEILAGWALEAARTLGIIEFKGWLSSKN
ncbi:MAG: hypothetical protein QXI90_02830 [Thermofilum sp.]